MRTGWIWGVLLASCAAPVRDYDAERIKAVDNLKELMDVQATVADPRFVLARKLDPKAMTKEQFREFVDMGTRLQLTARRLPEFSMGEGYDDYAKQLFSKAGSLLTYAQTGNGEKTLAEALSIRRTCAGCHSEFR